MAGLAGSPHMISATLFALTRVMYEFKDEIDGDLLEVIVDNTCLLLTAKAREVVKSALAFLKVLLSAYKDTMLALYLKKLMSSLVSMKEDCRHHFRFKSKEIYAKLIKKFGYETIYGMSPASIHKVLINIKKTQERNKKKKKTKAEEDDEDVNLHFKSQPESVDELLRDTDSELEDEEEGKKKKQVKGQKQKVSTKKSGSVWLQEGNEMEITDFLDPNTSKKVLATKPTENSKVKLKSKESEFKTAPDGRLIITESSDEEDIKGKGRAMSEDEDDLEDLFEALEGGTKSKKAKKRKLEDLGSDDEGDQITPKYKAGGSGIHRPVGKVAKTDRKQEYGAEYKAKKAAGDVKKKGKLDPYAYVPLDYKAMNKRKKAKFQGQFQNLVKGAKKGAMKGSKGKKKK